MKNKKLKFEVEMTNYEHNDLFLCASVPVCYSSFNRNMSHISKECADNMFAKAGYIPVVAEIKKVLKDGEEVTDFGSHGGRVEIDDDGIRYVDTTIVVGCVINEPYTMTEIDGKDYYTVRVALYKEKYPQIEDIINNTKVNQSMELSVIEGEYKEDGYLYINEAKLTSLCLLSEDVMPCFEGSQIQTFSSAKDKFEFEYTEIVEKVKSIFAKEEDTEDNAEEATGEEEDTSNEEDTTDEDQEEEEFASDEDKKKCEEDEEEETQTDEETEPVENTDEETETEEEEEEFTKEEYEALVVEFAKMKAKYETLEEEVTSLREFKKNIEDVENKAKVDEVCSKFDLEEEEISELRNKAYSCEITLEKLEDKLFALVGRKLLKAKSFSKEKETVASTKIKTEETYESKYGSLAKYLSKN